MIIAYSGDSFLVRRAVKRAFEARGFAMQDVTELAEGMTGGEVAQLAAQSGLFGSSALLLDFSAAFKGQAGVKGRNEVMKVLNTIPEDSLVIVIDLEATPARQKNYKKLGEFEQLPTPRFAALSHWIRLELESHALTFEKSVPDTLADLFGEDLPSIAAEINKLSVLDEKLTSEQVIRLVNRPASRSAFDLIDAISAKKPDVALKTIHSLIAQGEAANRILGALTWQYNLLARAVAIKESRSRVDATVLTQTLKVAPFVAKKTLALSQNIDEVALKKILLALLDADVAIKTGKNDQWALEALALKLATR